MDVQTADPYPSTPPLRPSSRPSSVPSDLAAGKIVAGKYELLRRIGTGAMGEVWAARHKTLDEEVAIKLVLRHTDHEDGTSAESRFLLEARVAASLSRKTRHIVAVTDHGSDGALGYLVMELLEGESLDAAIARTGPLPLEKVVPLITQIARGLSIAHAEGVMHRDLKPSNIFVTFDEDGKPVAKVLDFGIAKLRRNHDRKAAHATQRGFRLGTPAYMSPEQARGKPLDHRTDVWALTVIAYHMLTGEFPFDGASGEELFARLRRGQCTPIRDRVPELPMVVGDFFARAFTRRIENRFQSALSLAGAFEQLQPLAEGMDAPVPRTPALAMVEVDFHDAGLAEPSLFAAGVPKKWRVVGPVLAALLLAAVVVSTVTLLGVYFEREPTRTAQVSVAPSVVGPSAAAVPAIPPPEPVEDSAGPTVISTDDLPAAAAVPRASRPAAPLTPLAPHAPVAGNGATADSTPPATPPARGPRTVDKAEIF